MKKTFKFLTVFLLALLGANLQPAWATTYTFCYQKNMPSDWWEANQSQTMTQSSAYNKRYYCTISLDASSSYGIYVKEDGAFYKNNTTAESNQKVQLYKYDTNNANRVTFTSGSAGTYIFTYDADTKELFVSPQSSQTIVMEYVNTNGTNTYDGYWCLGDQSTLTLTQEGSSAKYSGIVNLTSAKKHYMYVKIGEDLYWRGTTTLSVGSSTQLYFYEQGGTCGGSGDKINFTPSSAGLHKFTWNHLDKTMKMERVYTVTYNANNATSGSAPAATNYVSGATVTVASNSGNLAKTGYDFGGWNTNTSGTGTNYVAGSGTFTITSDKNLYAKWTPQVYDITYKDQDGADFTGENEDELPATHTYGTATTLVNATRAGYRFDGWFENSACTGSAITEIGATAKTADFTLYAKWTEDKVYYDVTSGVKSFAGTTEQQTSKADLSISATSGEYNSSTNKVLASSILKFTVSNIATGYAIEGWYSNAACSVKIAGAGTSNTYTTPAVDGDVSVYVKILATQYNITYNNVYGTNPNPSSYNVEDEITFQPIIDYRTGYEFTSWSPASITKGTTGAQTVTAQWTAKQYTISFNQNGGEGGQTATVTATYDQPMQGTVTCPTRFGYEFQGYYYNNTQYYNANGTSAHIWDVDQNDITLTAKWTELECYMEGRFHIRRTKGGDWVDVKSNGVWDLTSKTIKFTLDEENKYYKLETNLPMYDLSYTIGGDKNDQYFSIKQVLKDGDINTAKEYMQNEDCYFKPSMAGKDNAKSWGVSDDTYKYRPHFGNDDKSGYVTIYFNENQLWFEIEPATLHNVTITTYGGGSVNPRGTYQIGPFQWDISATADYGYKFDGWTVSGDIQVDNINNPYAKITATGDGTISANFKQLANIYFQTNGDWGNNPVYIYFYKNNYYDDAKGSGSKTANGCIWGPAKMDYTGANSIHRYPLDIDDLTNLHWNGHVAFTPDELIDSENFFDTKVVYCNSFDFCDNNNMIKATTWQKDLNKSGDKHASYYNYEKVHADGAPSSYYILFGSENWKEKDENMFQDAKGYTVIKHYEVGANDEFRIRQNCGNYWGCNDKPTVAKDEKNWNLYKDLGNLAIHPWMSGDYEFKFDVMNHTLNVTYLGDIIISNFPGEISGFVNRSIKISPEVRLRNTQQKDVTVKFNGTDGALETELATYQQSGTNIVIVGKKTGSETISIQYRNTRGYTVDYSLKVNVAAPIVIQAKLTDDETSWTKTDLLHVHFWSTDGDKAQDASMTYNSESGIYSVTIPKIVDGDGNINFLFWYGENINMLGGNDAKWRQTDNMQTKVDRCYTIGYNSASDAYRVATPETGLCESGAYQIEVSMRNGNTYLSNIVTTESESKTFSFFAPKDNDVTYKGGTVRLLMDGSVVKELTGFSQAGVYVADLNGDDITTPALYNGDYYVIAGVSGSELNDDTKMHKFTPRANTAEDYSYYWTVYSGNCTDKNVIAKVANEYNSNLSLTIGADALTQADGKVEAGNVRFSYEPTTNAFKRAILGASNSNDFLNVYGNNVYANADATQPLTEDQSLDLSKFTDNSDWVYEKVVYVKVENVGSESKVTLKSVFNGQTSHLLGYEIDETTGEEKKDQPKQLTVLGTGSTPNNTPYQIRISYDFKKNRLISSWEPAEGTYNEDMAINSDVFFIRTEDDNVQQVQVGIKDGGTESYKISSLQHVMFVMEIDGSTDKTSYSQYWISLPFDCQISDIFGVEGYITLDENRIAQKGTWGIMRYRGDLRAQKGWFKETDGFWEWMYENETMYAGEGYVLFFERESIKDWPTIEDKYGNKKALKRLYFPSAQAGFVMSNTVDAEHSQFECKSMRCTIKTPEDREAYDSNWRVIGPKSYNNITAQTIQTDNPYGTQTQFPNFLYTYDTSKPKGQKYIAQDGKEFNYQSFHAYMVQYEGTITWVPYTQTTPPATVAAHYVEDSNFKGGTLTIELMQNNEQLDRAFIKLDEKGTAGYDFSQDLTKITENCAQIASVSEDVLYAGNTLPLDIEMVPLNVKVVANGTYDIALAQSLEGLEVRLYDAFEQTTTPLDLMSATITLDKGEYKDRFFLQFVQKSPLTPTNLNGAIEQFNLPTDKTQKLLINDNIYLINGGRIYNVLGARP